MSFKRNEQGIFQATKHFKMPKVFKRLAATLVNKDQRDAWLSCSKQAVMQSFEVLEKKSKKEKFTGVPVIAKTV